MTRRTPTILLAAGATSLVLMTGCGSNDSKDTTSTPAAAAATTTTAATTADPTAKAATAAPATGPVKVALNEWKVVPDATVHKAGKVTFDVTNDGKSPHEMVVIKTDKGAGDLGSGARVSEAGSAGEAGDIAPGKAKSVTLDLKPGHYALICNIAGHYTAGMYADFTVR
jgi:uncharacterized cupredoxin-like copper-binding protein